MRRVDYDLIAPRYDERLRDHALDAALVRFLERRDRGRGERARVLDIGCGTGKQIAVHAAALPEVGFVGVDRSIAMLRIARGRCPGAQWIHGDGARLPLVDDAFDYASSQFSYQHIGDTTRLLSEAYRVLRPGGRLVVTNIDPWSMTGWLVYRFFPEAFAVDQRDFVPFDDLVALMRRVGFVDVQAVRDDRTKPERLEAFFAYASGRHRASQFLAVSDEAYAAGLRRLEAALRDAPVGLEVPSPFVLVTIAGGKPARPSAPIAPPDRRHTAGPPRATGRLTRPAVAGS